jgi:hypothetical protein
MSGTGVVNYWSIAVLVRDTNSFFHYSVTPLLQ